jgi:hypothetical protein
MPRSTGKVHVVRVKRAHVDKQGQVRDYESVYLRRTFRDGARVRNETVANLSMLPEAAVAAIEATLKGQTLVPAGGEFTITRALAHGHVAAVAAMARALGLPALVGPPCRERDLVVGLIISRVIHPASKLSTLSRWGDCTLGSDLASPAHPPATEAALAAIAERVERGTLTGAGRIGEAVGKVITNNKVGKHFQPTITDTTFSYQRDHAGIAAEAALDGIYVLRTSVPATELDPAAVMIGYKNLAHLDRDFRSIKTDDLDLRPIHHRLTDRVKAHVLICLLACYLTWHLRKAWAPLTFTDEHPPARTNPVAPAQRSPAAQAKASHHQAADGAPLRSFRALLHHLSTLTRNRIRYHDTTIEIDTLTQATPDQRRAFDLIEATIPLITA